MPDKTSLNRQQLIDTCNSWLRWNYCWPSREWAYRTIEPRVMVEEFISDGTGPAPTDYKFYIFGERAHMTQVDAGRFGPNHRSEINSTSWGQTARQNSFLIRATNTAVGFGICRSVKSERAVSGQKGEDAARRTNAKVE